MYKYLILIFILIFYKSFIFTEIINYLTLKNLNTSNTDYNIKHNIYNYNTAYYYHTSLYTMYDIRALRILLI